MPSNNDLVRAAAQGKSATSLGWIYIRCPLCNSRRTSLSLNVDTGWWRCFRCGEEGRLKGNVEYGVRAERKAAPSTREWVSLADPEVCASMAVRPALEYLSRRRVLPHAIAGAGLGYGLVDKIQGRIVLPIRDDAGVVVGVVARTPIDGVTDPYYNTEGLARVCMPGREILRNNSTVPVYGVEGPFDLLPYWGWAWSFLGKPTADQLNWIAQNAKRPVIIALDGDAHREGTAAAARLKIRGVQASYLRLPPTTDPGSIQLPAPWSE